MQMPAEWIGAACRRADAIRPVVGSPETSPLRQTYPKLRLSTARTYFDALQARCNNDASDHIDAGLEPCLVSDEALTMGLHPFIEVYDVAVSMQLVDLGDVVVEMVCLELSGGACLVRQDVLLAWR